MNLLVDLGNSRLKWAYAGPDQWQTMAAPVPTGALAELLDTQWAGMDRPRKVVVASVASGATLEALNHWVQQHWSLTPQVVRTQRELLGVKNNYREPATLGVDRWVALIAAYRLTPGPVCVVDCGTALTIDALSANGEFLGGVIFPGLRLLGSSLLQVAPGIREAEGDGGSCFGLSTADGVTAGSVFGLAGAIERVLAEHRRELGDNTEVLVTGADAPRVLSRLRLPGPATEVPDLVLKGLALIADEVL